MKLLAEAIVKAATKEVGTEEVNGTNCGPRVDQYKAATVLPPHESWPWCAAFVCWCVWQAMLATGIKETATFKRPTTASAWNLENWSLQQDGTTQTKRGPGRGDIEAGDIVIFTFSHVGIATGPVDADGMVPTIEGNTDGGGSREGGCVMSKKRRLSVIKTRIRFTV
jgi:hypothetical protein